MLSSIYSPETTIAPFFKRPQINNLDQGEIEILEDATDRGNFCHYLTYEDIADIARLQYHGYMGTGNLDSSLYEFQIVGAPSQLKKELELFQIKTQQMDKASLTLLVNLCNQHWVALVVSYKNMKYKGYYLDSMGNRCPNEYYQVLKTAKVELIQFCFHQQKDSYNCAIWALKNARYINKMLNIKKSPEWLIERLRYPRNSSYFEYKRKAFSTKLRADPLRTNRYDRRDTKSKGDEIQSLLSQSENFTLRNPVLKQLQEEIDTQMKIKSMETLLDEAVQLGQVNKVRLLLDRGVNANLVLSDNGATPLHLAVLVGYKAQSGYEQNIVELLLEKGANPNLTAEYGITPLHLAAQLGYEDVVELLLENGANPNAEVLDGHTPCSLAIQFGHKNIKELLLEHGATLNDETKKVCNTNLRSLR